MALEGRFNMESVEVEQSRIAFVQQRRAGAMLALMRSNGERNHVPDIGVLRLLLLLHLNAALRCYGDGVDEVHAVNALLERSFQGGVAQQSRLPLRQFAVIGNSDALNIAFADWSAEQPELLGKMDVWIHLTIFFVGQGRDVDGILNHTALQIFLHLKSDLYTHKFLRFIG